MNLSTRNLPKNSFQKSGEAVDFQEAKRLKSDPERQANCHEKVAQAIFYEDKQQAREAIYQSMQEFWQDGARKEEQKWDKDTISLAERF